MAYRNVATFFRAKVHSPEQQSPLFRAFSIPETTQNRKESSMNLIVMNKIETMPVRWLWYPYIPYGKITLVQGDPGDGKTTFVLPRSSGGYATCSLWCA
jgi:hypothetical protein